MPQHHRTLPHRASLAAAPTDQNVRRLHTQAASGGLQMELVEVDNGGAEELNFILGAQCVPGASASASHVQPLKHSGAIMYTCPALLYLPLPFVVGRPGALHQDGGGHCRGAVPERDCHQVRGELPCSLLYRIKCG